MDGSSGSSSSSSGSGSGGPGVGGYYTPAAAHPQQIVYDPSSNATTSGAVKACCCGAPNGNTRRLCSLLGPKSRLFPGTCVIGPDYPCLFVTYALLLGPTLAFIILCAPSLHVAVIVIEAFLIFIVIAFLSVTAGSDPGILQKQTPVELEVQRERLEEEGRAQNMTVCVLCNVYREPGTSHCYDCNACIIELDHHCPWTGKCIGKYNLKYFYGFVWSMCGLIFFTGGAFITWLVRRSVM